MPQAISFSTGFTNAWSNVATFIPKFVVFLIILIVGYIIAKAIAKILSRLLTRVGFDRLVERGGVKAALGRSQYDASDILAKLVYYAIMLFVLSTAFGVFGSNPISDYLRAVIAYLPLVFNAILYAVLAALVGIAVVAVGGSGIKTMAQRWEAVAARYDEEKPRIAGPCAALLPFPAKPRQYAGDLGRPYDEGAPAPGTVARPHVERPDDRRY